MLSATSTLYNLKVYLHDLRAADVASLFATYERWPDIRDGTAATLARWRRRCSYLANPVISWKVAFDFYRHTTGETYQSTLALASHRRHPRAIQTFRVLYRAVNAAELPRWKAYLAARVRAKGWDDAVLLRGLARLPRSMAQGHRWYLFKLHLNAPTTTARMAASGVLQEPERCCFCRVGEDSLAHVARCPAVLLAYDALALRGHLPPLSDARHVLMLQEEWMVPPLLVSLQCSRLCGMCVVRAVEE